MTLSIKETQNHAHTLYDIFFLVNTLWHGCWLVLQWQLLNTYFQIYFTSVHLPVKSQISWTRKYPLWLVQLIQLLPQPIREVYTFFFNPQREILDILSDLQSQNLYQQRIAILEIQQISLFDAVKRFAIYSKPEDWNLIMKYCLKQIEEYIQTLERSKIKKQEPIKPAKNLLELKPKQHQKIPDLLLSRHQRMQKLQQQPILKPIESQTQKPKEEFNLWSKLEPILLKSPAKQLLKYFNTPKPIDYSLLITCIRILKDFLAKASIEDVNGYLLKDLDIILESFIHFDQQLKDLNHEEGGKQTVKGVSLRDREREERKDEGVEMALKDGISALTQINEQYQDPLLKTTHHQSTRYFEE